MNKRIIILVTLLLAGVVTFSASTAATPDPQIATLKKQLRDARSDKSDLQDTIRGLRLDKSDLDTQIDAQDDLIGSQADTITRLRVKIATWPDPVDVIMQRDADGQWAAMTALWRAFPRLPEGALCGYDKTNTPGENAGFTLASYSFYRFSGC